MVVNRQDIGMMIRVAKEYYELKMDQDQIAKKENISKSTVSRLTRKAAELGYVKIEVDFQAFYFLLNLYNRFH